MMHFVAFLRELFEHGNTRVADQPIDAGELEEAIAELTDFEAQWRLEMPGEPPRFCAETALWAAKTTYRACTFVTFRDLAADLAARELQAPCPVAVSPSVHYSADLTLRFLPDIYRLASLAARDDPLLDSLRELARRWPLSSVGMRDLGEIDVTFLRHPALLQLYVDRVIASHDDSRLTDPAVRDAARQALGCFSELDSQTAQTLETRTAE